MFENSGFRFEAVFCDSLENLLIVIVPVKMDT